MKRGSRMLLTRADAWWPGSADRLVAVNESLACDREGGLYVAATIVTLLRNPPQRAACLRNLLVRVPDVSRRGPKRDRAEAARAALLSLLADVEAADRAAGED